MRVNRTGLRVLVVIAALSAAACGGGGSSSPTSPSPSTPSNPNPTPGLQPTFASIQSLIFESNDSNGRPACNSCHNAVLASANGGLDLSHNAAYTSLVNAASRDKAGATRVIPGNAAGSYLIQKLEGASGIVGSRMPVSGPFLTTAQITVIRDWISAGAANN